MSADNGIYILETKGPEFRVAHLQAVDNVYYDWGILNEDKKDTVVNAEEVDDPDVWIVNARDMWFGSPVFVKEEDAWEEARKTQDEIDYTEYGISKIVIDRKFKPSSFVVEVYNPVYRFGTFKEAFLFVMDENTEPDTITFSLANGENIKMKRNENGEIVIDKFEME